MDTISSQIAAAQSAADLEELKIAYLGKNGKFTLALSALKSIGDMQKRKLEGQRLNQQKQDFLAQFEARSLALLERSDSVVGDSTLPGITPEIGAVHPITETIAQITEIFSKVGFYRVNYPEIEYEFFSFDSLNMPASHPARDEFESFAVNGPKSEEYGKMVLSPHTSSGQVREMWRRKKGLPAGTQAPVRMINIARCFRRNWDITHTPMFHQFEGLCIDQGIGISHLKGAISHFVKEYFGYDVKIRLRPYHFQFTEPSFEIDTTCTICHGTQLVNGEKCRVCKSGWLELGGAGMVHSNVLKAGKVDPQKYSGWAFGFGVERVYMMKYQLNDIRRLYSGELNIYQTR